MSTTLALIRRVPHPHQAAYVAALDGGSGIRVLARCVGEALTSDQLLSLRRRRLEISMRAHPALVALIGIRERDDGIWLLEAEPALTPLATVWNRVVALGEESRRQAAQAVLLTVGGALCALHGWRGTRGAPIPHGALSPATIGIREDGRVVLGRYSPDLLASSVDEPYLGPEGRVGAPVDQAGDLYALGATLLELLGGPAQGPHDRRYASAYQLACSLEGRWEGLGQLLLALLHPEPMKRVEAAVGPLRRAVSDMGASAQSMPPVEVLRPTPEERSKWMTAPTPAEQSDITELDFDFDFDSDFDSEDGAIPEWMRAPVNQQPTPMGPQPRLPNYITDTPDTETGYWDSVELSAEAAYYEEPPSETLVPADSSRVEWAAPVEMEDSHDGATVIHPDARERALEALEREPVPHGAAAPVPAVPLWNEPVVTAEPSPPDPDDDVSLGSPAQSVSLQALVPVPAPPPRRRGRGWIAVAMVGLVGAVVYLFA